ncbi:TPM domain-containing protein [Vagococcus xieshaowenii]|uniref:TPM domain-containing protein n=1 Tax=Vagococcus xieshaowenii TaxID=2562451 RepID=A0AAJ5JL79_9ENTE|nr:TPM domain-containing protein [Vagococcus xieshaowenii]QCA29099.1 TPM domain-containing protein [Vagococcus xieshaowenii]TFZ40925.1 TPM domain-containing protein [Vagococcus xieshaowenii]
MKLAIKYYTMLLFGLVFFLFPTPQHAANEIKVLDHAGLFTLEEKAKVEQEVKSFIAATNMDAVVLTINNAEGYATRDYAADFYDYNGYGIGKHFDGFIFIIDMDNREFYVVTSGKTHALLSDSRINTILDNAEPYMRNGNYALASQSVINTIEQFNLEGMPNGYIYNEETGQLIKQKKITGLEFLFAFVIASIAAIAAYASVNTKYSLKKSTYSYPYTSQGQLNLSTQKNDLVDVRVTKRFIPRPTTTRGTTTRGGGSFTSGSGRSHGGGGRGF